MKDIVIQNKIRPLMLSAFDGKNPSIKGIFVIDHEAIITANGEIIAVYKKIPFDLRQMRAACINMKFSTYERTSGLMTQTENINASPRNARRMNKCRLTKLHRGYPHMHQVFLDYARLVAKEYRQYFPTQYAQQIKRLFIGRNRVHSAYRIAGTPFTSGVVNKDSALRYHRDAANTEDGISCMVVLKEGVAGGELVLPELNIAFACQDGYLLLFDGQRYIHGVTPILQPIGGKGYRYTTVYYNNKGMSLCLSPEEEEQYYRKHLEKLTNKRYLEGIKNGKR